MAEFPQAAPLLLFADDDAGTCELIRAIFERENFRVVTVATAERMIEEVNRLCEVGDCPDVIVSDVHFFNSNPRARGVRLSGISAAFQIHNKFRNLPILFLSGMSDTLTRENAKQAANAPVIKKPFIPSELVARVRDALRFSVPRYEGRERRRFGVNVSGNLRRRTDRRVELPVVAGNLHSEFKTNL